MPPKINIYYYWVPSKPPTITVKMCEDVKCQVDRKSSEKDTHFSL